MSYVNSLRVVAIIQARLTSTRLPRKILKKIGEQTILEHVIARIKETHYVSHIVIASPHEIPIKLDIPVFIGNEEDVLDRYYQCAKKYQADAIVRITSDCPLIDPYIVDYAIIYYSSHSFPYVCFAPVDGLDVEVFSYNLLAEAWQNAKTSYEREHVTPYMKSKTKISVDTEEDLEKVRKVYGL